MDIELLAPFTVHEAEFALYLADRDGNVNDPAAVFLGGRLVEIDPEVDFQKVRLDRHGSPYSRIYHADEEHRFTVRNLWIMQRSSRSMPRIRRNQQYVFVLRWFDEQSRAWVLRSYFGVTADGQKLLQQNEAFHQDVPFDARYMTERSGLGTPPEMTPVVLGSVRYVTASEVVDLYTYDFATGNFSVVDPALLAGRASLEISGANWRVKFGATVALEAAAADGVHVHEITAVGGTFSVGETQFPRVEFWIGATRIAGLTAAGELAVPDFAETNAAPELGGALPGFVVEVAGDWVLTLAQGTAYAPSFNEDLT